MTVQLRNSEVRLQRVLQGGHDGWWDLDMQSASFYASPRTWQMLGYSDDGPQPPFNDWAQLVHPKICLCCKICCNPRKVRPRNT
jgi:PAS domain-containing protein